MRDATGYLRVSTAEQKRSGWGLAAQRFDIKRFAAREADPIYVEWALGLGRGRKAYIRPQRVGEHRSQSALVPRKALVVGHAQECGR
jgi:hypothetical protein